MNKRIFSLLLCLCMVLTMLPALPAAAATELASYYGTNEVGTGGYRNQANALPAFAGRA